MEIKIWRIPKSEDFPEGIKYSMAYIRVGTEKAERVLGYDNEKGKGHHRHYFDREEKIAFKDWNELVEMFKKDVERLRRELYGHEG